MLEDNKQSYLRKMSISEILSKVHRHTTEQKKEATISQLLQNAQYNNKANPYQSYASKVTITKVK